MRFWYIPLADETKRPIAEFGGWPIDPTRDTIFSLEEVQEIDHDNWAIVGNRERDLLVIDIDLYKMDEETQEAVEHGWFGFLDETRIVKTQSGGIHIYARFDGDEIPRPIEHVDIKGDVGKGYAVASFSPGYEITNEKEPATVGKELLKSFPVFRDEVQERDSGWSQAKKLLAKYDIPPCYEIAADELGSDDFAAKFITHYHRSKGHPQEILEEAFEEHHENGNWRQAINDVQTDTLLVHDVLDRSYKEGVRDEHPSFLHSSPSESGSNFMVDDGGETFRCWRHDATGNAFHLLGVKGGFINCGDWLSGISKETWLDIFQYAKDQGYDLDDATIDCQDVIDEGYCPYRCDRTAPHISP